MFLKLSQFQIHRFNFNINNTRLEEQSVKKKKLLQNLKAIIGIFILNSFIPIKPRFDIKNTPTLLNCTILYEESSARIPPRKKKKKKKKTRKFNSNPQRSFFFDERSQKLLSMNQQSVFVSDGEKSEFSIDSRKRAAFPRFTGREVERADRPNCCYGAPVSRNCAIDPTVSTEHC